MKNLWFVLLLCGGSVSSAQVVLRGEVLGDPGTACGDLSVQIEALGSAVTTQHVVVESDGRFTFRDGVPGTYRLRILDSAGNEITSESLSVLPGNVPVTVRLPERKMERPSGASVSVERLRYQPSKRALRAFLEAQRLSKTNAHESAAAALERALSLGPQFIEPHGNLRVQYAILKQYDRAADEFRRAIALDPATAQHQSKLALVLLSLGQSAEACSGRGMVSNSTGPTRKLTTRWAAFSCGTPRVGPQEFGKQLAAREFPKAHWTLAEVYRITGEKDLAREKMQQYLAADPSANKAAAEQWSSSLR